MSKFHGESVLAYLHSKELFTMQFYDFTLMRLLLHLRRVAQTANLLSNRNLLMLPA